ncbi:MAG: hypothetical protein ACE5FZ_06470 [Nitrospiria bacterium]
MRRWVILLALFMFIPGCGDTAPKDAVVTGPPDETFTIESPGGGPWQVRPLIFSVKDGAGRIIPDIELEIIANNGILVDVSGKTIAQNPPENDILVTRTNSEGAVTVSISVTLPTCGTATSPITFNSSVSASTGFVNAISKQTWTIKCP